jgi:hypothetical protein
MNFARRIASFWRPRVNSKADAKAIPPAKAAKMAAARGPKQLGGSGPGKNNHPEDW